MASSISALTGFFFEAARQMRPRVARGGVKAVGVDNRMTIPMNQIWKKKLGSNLSQLRPENRVKPESVNAEPS